MLDRDDLAAPLATTKQVFVGDSWQGRAGQCWVPEAHNFGKKSSFSYLDNLDDIKQERAPEKPEKVRVDQGHVGGGEEGEGKVPHNLLHLHLLVMPASQI